jgi:hypothetical protein
LDEWREKAYHSSKLYKERTKRWHDKREIRYSFSTLMFVCLVMVNLEASGKAPS